MNRPLKISLLGNLLLTVVVLWLVHRLPAAADHLPVSVVVEITNAPTQPANAAPEPKPFRWSQLESTNDYRVYVANLRAIGCPEKIVRAIVQMDAGGAFAFKRAQLRLDGSGTGLWSQFKEMEYIATLLGETPAATEQASAPPAEQHPAPWQTRQPDPSLPLVLQPVDENALQLTDAQKQVLGQLRQQFLDEIGGTNQDPNDPAYLARWQKAQRGIDDTLRGLLGLKLYLDYRQQAANAAPFAH